MSERDLAAWAAELRRIAATTLPAVLMKNAKEAALDAQGRAAKKVKGGKPLHSRSNHLYGSIKGYVEQGPGIVVRLEATAKYAATHEFGAVIRPVRSQYLAIPMNSAKTAGGDARRPGPRDYPEAFFFRSERGQGFIARSVGGNLELLFILRRQVTIPKRPFIRPSMQEATEKLRGRLAGALKKAALEAQRGR